MPGTPLAAARNTPPGHSSPWSRNARASTSPSTPPPNGDHEAPSQRATRAKQVDAVRTLESLGTHAVPALRERLHYLRRVDTPTVVQAQVLYVLARLGDQRAPSWGGVAAGPRRAAAAARTR
ncbi:MAG: hypothetical protein ABIP94_25395 [Planctomycetota bacterium]